MKNVLCCNLMILAVVSAGLMLSPVESTNAQQAITYELVDTGIPWEGARRASSRLGLNNLGIVWIQKSWLFDLNGHIGAKTPRTTYALGELVDVPTNWTTLLIHDMNDNGTEIVGRVSSDSGEFRGFYCDLGDIDPTTGKAVFQLLPDYGYPKTAPRGINNDGDVVVQAQFPDGTWTLLTTNTSDLTVAVPTFLGVADGYTFALNNRVYDGSGNMVRDAQVICRLPETSDLGVFTLGTPPSSVININQESGFDGRFGSGFLNDTGNVAGTVAVTSQGKGKKNSTTTNYIAALLEFPFAGPPEWLSNSESTATVNGINNSDDVLFEEYSVTEKVYLSQEGSLIDLDDVAVSGSSADVDFWNARDGIRGDTLNERNASGSPQLLVYAWVTSGKGRNQIQENRQFLLVPVVD